MKKVWQNPVVAFLSSLKLGAVLMIIVLVAAGKATLIENDFGRDGAYAAVYAARWFEALLSMITVNLILNLFRRWPYELKNLGSVLVHLSVIVILIGAGMTRYLGYEGMMSIREGETVDYILSDKNHVKATLGDETTSYPVRLHQPGETDEWRSVTLGGQRYELGVTEYWPHFTQAYTPGPGGRPALRFGVSEQGEVVEKMLLMGERTEVGQASARYLVETFSDQVSTSRYGDLRVRIDGQSCRFPVAVPDGKALTCGGYTFEITEFQTDFRVGGVSDPTGPLVNPMIRLQITTADGRTGERILFAFHPEFSMGHSGDQEDFGDLELLYELSLGLEFAGRGENLQGRASFPLQTMDMETQEQLEIAAGEVFAVTPRILYVNDANDISFVPVETLDSVVLGPSLSTNANAPPAARLVIRDAAGQTASAIGVRGQVPERVELGDQTIKLAYGPEVKTLPYSLRLDDFVLQTYPGSENPATYESFVTLVDKEQGIAGQSENIYMNHPLNHRNTKHFQSSYDSDRLGTVLSVNYDPGMWPTYVGYMMITVGFILIMLKGAIWPSKRNRAGTTALALLIGLVLGRVGAASAQESDPHAGHDHGPAETTPVSFVILSPESREAASRLVIQDYQGRMKPLDTLAREMVMKVAKKTRFRDRQPVDMYLNWSLNPSFWWTEDVLAVRHGGLKELLGVDPTVKHVSPASLFANGGYRLNDAVREAHQTPDRDRTKTQRKLISFDERFNLLYMTFRGSTLRLFPVPGDENNTWLDIESVAGQLDAAQLGVYEEAYVNLGEGLHTDDPVRIATGIAQIAEIQATYGAQVLPSALQLKAELTYNRSHLFSWMMVPLLVAFGILIIVSIWNLFRRGGERLGFRNPFYALGVSLYTLAFAGMVVAYVMRWIASGRAPLSNGHESLLFISLAVALAGLIFELVYRIAAPAALAALLTVVVLGVSMLSVFDPAIGPLMPVLVSYWLNIHVTIITASYGFLGLSALIGIKILFLLMGKGPGRSTLRANIHTLDRINHHVIIAGLGFLTVGTLLGGVWANESWGRYWGWDPKETWSLVTILVYAVVLHIRFIPALRSVWLYNMLTMWAIGSVIMTYFGVNYFLSGLHSYAQGDAATVPSWVFIMTWSAALLMVVTGFFAALKSWEPKDGEPA